MGLRMLTVHGKQFVCAEFEIRAESVRSGVRSPAQHDETWLDFIVTFVIVVVYLIFRQSSTTLTKNNIFSRVVIYVSEMVTLLNLCHLNKTIFILNASNY